MAEQDVQGLLIRIEATAAQMLRELDMADKAVASTSQKIDKQLSRVDKAFDSLNATISGSTTRAMESLNASVASAYAHLEKLSGGVTGTAAESKQLSSLMAGASQSAAKIVPHLDANAAAMEKGGISAAQYSQAMRMLPMQLTDVVTSLASGMPVWQVTIQQGGQIRDAFGGIGSAGRALIGSINPVTGALVGIAGAAAVLYSAYEQGAAEAQAYEKALILSGNAAGTSADALASMARIMDAGNTTQRNAAAVLAEVAGTGKFAENQILAISRAAVGMEQATGKAVSETVKDFTALAESPAEASAKLNEQYHYLTASVYEQIAALEEQGKTSEAAKLATDSYASALQQRSMEIEENLGLLERAWNGVGRMASEAWDAMLGIGRKDTLEQQLAEVDGKLKNLEKNPFSDSWFGSKTAKAELEQKRTELQLSIQQRDTEAAWQAEQAKLNQDAIAAQKEIATLREQSLSKSEKKAKEVADYMENLEKIRAVNPSSSLLDQAQIDKDLAAIEAKYKETAKRAKEYQDDAATKMLQDLRNQQANLTSQLSTVTKLTESEQKLAEFTQLVADLKGKAILTAEQKSLLANQDLIKAQLQQNAALEQQIKQRDELARQAQLQSALDEQIANRQNAVSIGVAGIGMGDRARQDMEQINAIQQSYARQITALASAQGTPNGLSEEAYAAQVAALKRAQDQEIAIYQDGAQQKLAAEQDWTKGATRAIENYRDGAQNIAGQMDSLFTNAFSSMEDAVARFATTGKLSFSDFAKSILADMARIEARRAASSLLSGIGSLAVSAVGSLFGGGGGYSGGAAAGSLAGSSYSFNPALDVSGLAFNAKGGVYDSPSLSAYSGGVYDSPQLFAFAKGAGVFGEAGPEAIMPLTRGPDGSLGVRAVGGGGGGATSLVIHAPVSVQAQPGMSSQDAARQGAQIGQAMTAEIRRQIGTELRQGGLIWRAMSGRG